MISKDSCTGRAFVAVNHFRRIYVWSIVVDVWPNPSPWEVSEYALALRIDSRLVREALRYYQDHKDEIDSLIAENR